MKKHPAEIILRALLYGLEVKNKVGDVYVYVQPEEEHGPESLVCLKVEGMFIPVDLTLEDMVKIGNELSEDELFVLGANVAMRQMQLENIERRSKPKK